MYIVHSLTVAILFCVITMLGWGSWANTLKLAERRSWPFALFYWDYAIGILLCSIVFALTLGSHGAAGQSAFENLMSAGRGPIFYALASGALFNLSNILFVLAADATGLSVAFTLAVGLALVVGTIGSYLQHPSGNALLLFGGVSCVLVAMLLSALASSGLDAAAHASRKRGIVFAFLSGLLMGTFYPQITMALSPGFSSGAIVPGKMTPYSAAFIFGVGVLASNAIYNTVLMRMRGFSYRQFLGGRPTVHLWGIFGGAAWMIALVFNLIASGTAGPAVSYALGQGSTLVGAIWGVFVWREFRNAKRSTVALLAGMFASYAIGLLLVGAAAK